MNKAFKVIWSEARNAYVVVSEMAKSHGTKSCSTKKLLAMLIATGIMTCASVAPVMAANLAPTETKIEAGNGASASGEGSVAIGNNAQASELAAIAIGRNTVASGKDSIAFGADTKATQLYSVAILISSRRMVIFSNSLYLDFTVAFFQTQLYLFALASNLEPSMYIWFKSTCSNSNMRWFISRKISFIEHAITSFMK